MTDKELIFDFILKTQLWILFIIWFIIWSIKSKWKESTIKNLINSIIFLWIVVSIILFIWYMFDKNNIKIEWIGILILISILLIWWLIIYKYQKYLYNENWTSKLFFLPRKMNEKEKEFYWKNIENKKLFK